MSLGNSFRQSFDAFGHSLLNKSNHLSPQSYGNGFETLSPYDASHGLSAFTGCGCGTGCAHCMPTLPMDTFNFDFKPYPSGLGADSLSTTPPLSFSSSSLDGLNSHSSGIVTPQAFPLATPFIGNPLPDLQAPLVDFPMTELEEKPLSPFTLKDTSIKSWNPSTAKREFPADVKEDIPEPKKARNTEVDDWSQITDEAERRKVQNRNAQRKFREKEDLKKEKTAREEGNNANCSPARGEWTVKGNGLPPIVW